MRMGILTDCKRWLLRWPNAGPVRTVMPYAFTLEDADRWITLFEWLRDHALSAEVDKQPSRSAIAQHFGPTAPPYERDIVALKVLYDQHADSSTIRVKRQLWENLLTAALGEIARSSAQLDDLFVRHTYLIPTFWIFPVSEITGGAVMISLSEGTLQLSWNAGIVLTSSSSRIAPRRFSASPALPR